jgi:FkbM family methyltransferase
MSVSIAERKVVLDLFPYFNQKHPIVFDVGSNKGVWADILVHNVEMHLVEPNEILRHYTMAKYDYLDNVFYHENAWGDQPGKMKMAMYEKNYNGLSSLLENPKWENLPKRYDQVIVSTMNAMKGPNIDFLKIDVEGYELKVLRGASRWLSEKAIKFIQVEKADHIELTGETFNDLIAYMQKYRYVPMQTEDTENVIFMQEGFTQDWNGEFKKNTADLPKFNFALEIGAFEGLTSRYICDNLLLPGGRMIAVDPLTDEYLPGHEDNNLFVGQYDRFIRNTRNYPIELIRKTSREAFSQLQDYRFDFIYIDGDHRRSEVFNDGVQSLNILKPGGHILFDDYGWREETALGIDEFIRASGNAIKVIKKDYQVLVKRIAE